MSNSIPLKCPKSFKIKHNFQKEWVRFWWRVGFLPISSAVWAPAQSEQRGLFAKLRVCSKTENCANLPSQAHPDPHIQHLTLGGWRLTWWYLILHILFNSYSSVLTLRSLYTSLLELRIRSSLDAPIFNSNYCKLLWLCWKQRADGHT